jgi:hypothetical protein
MNKLVYAAIGVGVLVSATTDLAPGKRLLRLTVYNQLRRA